MKLKPKVALTLTALFAVLGLAQYLVQSYVLLPSFAELERDAARTDMKRVVRVLDREIDLLGITAADYGNWVDTYQFAADRNAEYIAVNLTPETIEQLRVNVMAFVDLQGDYVWSTGRDVATGETLQLDLLEGPGLPLSHPWRMAPSAGAATAGILRTNLGAMIAVMAPILDGQGQGPSRGMVLLGRLLTDDELARIGAQAQVNLSRHELLESDMPAAGVDDVLTEHESTTEVVRTLRSVAGHPVISLRITVPRSISDRGQQTVTYAGAFLVAAGIAVLLLTIVLLNRAVLGPLASVTRHAARIGQTEDLSARLNLERPDELGVLAGAFDGMVEKLADARRQLVDQTFEAGIAENASGILHNLGNAMTPFGVGMAELRHTLATMPMEDLAIVVGELQTMAADDGRKKDVLQFLRLTAEDLTESCGRARQQAEEIAQQSETLQNILAEQTRHCRAARPTESVLLPRLLQESARLVPEELRNRLSLMPEVSLTELGPVRLARTTMQQVLQNLVVNAAESVRDTGREQGVLRVSAGVETRDGQEFLRLSFTDNGVGILAEHLPRVFEKGFSTKSAMTNSGIGLHWCANALAGLGGGIEAESGGRGQGATIHVWLPLQRVGLEETRSAA